MKFLWRIFPSPACQVNTHAQSLSPCVSVWTFSSAETLGELYSEHLCSTDSAANVLHSTRICHRRHCLEQAVATFSILWVKTYTLHNGQISECTSGEFGLLHTLCAGTIPRGRTTACRAPSAPPLVSTTQGTASSWGFRHENDIHPVQGPLHVASLMLNGNCFMDPPSFCLPYWWTPGLFAVFGWVSVYLVFKETARTFPEAAVLFHTPANVWELVSLQSCQNWVFSFFNFLLPAGWEHTVVSVFTSQITNDVDHPSPADWTWNHMSQGP